MNSYKIVLSYRELAMTSDERFQPAISEHSLQICVGNKESSKQPHTNYKQVVAAWGIEPVSIIRLCLTKGQNTQIEKKIYETTSRRPRSVPSSTVLCTPKLFNHDSNYVNHPSKEKYIFRAKVDGNQQTQYYNKYGQKKNQGKSLTVSQLTKKLF